jgi:NADH-quinone oxidoreductase subunit A
MAAGVYWPFVVFFCLAMILTGGMIAVSWFLGERRNDAAGQKPFESGMLTSGSAEFRYSVTFYLVAMFFVIFDVESLFIFGWAIALRDLGWAGFIEIVIFIGILMAGLVYLWKLGVLNPDNRPKKRTETDPAK